VAKKKKKNEDLLKNNKNHSVEFYNDIISYRICFFNVQQRERKRVRDVILKKKKEKLEN
jgi:hypothetical protein